MITSRVAELITVSVMERPSVLDWKYHARIPGHAIAKHAGALDDFTNGLFLAVRHDVHTTDAADFTQLLDQFHAQLCGLPARRWAPHRPAA